MTTPVGIADIEIRLLIEAIFLRYGHDFRDYAQASLRRRILQAQQRMDAPSISALQERVLHDADQFAQLLQYLTVPVSEMFRDPAYFLGLRRHVVPVLRTYASLKVWVAGCSTGEEPYSLAILLHEEGLLERTILYATDINHASLEKARAGIFNLDAMQGFTRNYQRAGGTRSFSEYYTAAYGGALFDKRLRDAITFAELEHTGEIAGELAAHFIDLAVAELAAETGKRRAFAEAFKRFLQHGRHRGVLAGVNLLGHACWVVIQPRTFNAHAWVPCLSMTTGG